MERRPAEYSAMRKRAKQRVYVGRAGRTVTTFLSRYVFMTHRCSVAQFDVFVACALVFGSLDVFRRRFDGPLVVSAPRSLIEQRAGRFVKRDAIFRGSRHSGGCAGGPLARRRPSTFRAGCHMRMDFFKTPALAARSAPPVAARWPPGSRR